MSVMKDRESLVTTLHKLTIGMQILEVPTIWFEQIPEKMGSTIPELKQVLESLNPIEKSSFSCCGEQSFIDKLKALNRNQIIIAGIECHVCVYQTAADLIAKGYEVKVVTDAVSSRTEFNRNSGIHMMKSLGVKATCMEALLFELLKDAKHPKFRDILRLVK